MERIDQIDALIVATASIQGLLELVGTMEDGVTRCEPPSWQFFEMQFCLGAASLRPKPLSSDGRKQALQGRRQNGGEHFGRPISSRQSMAPWMEAINISASTLGSLESFKVPSLAPRSLMEVSHVEINRKKAFV
ncbi:hypothetical protein FHT91_004940 [Rhizobium sp. BK347]|jgi:hypothetical protein|nr:hypothetical protein [Rhizobium sp. BK252]MBB3404887.1 hypothetical protein [Rhizobium sp. BK289]MBB3417433.1 hypothetical protein [Rhizobium sp. BK284]MBB3485143.1 hypothetical protein [Rhizobium sp. BK347]